MSYRESRLPFRKLWRKEPARRQAELSYHARTLAVFLLRHADDTGCLGPVSKSGHAAALLAQMLAIPSRNRKAFYRELQELLDYGDDHEPLALVMRDQHFYLSRFEECQAVRHNRDKTERQPGQERDKSGTEQGTSLGPNPAEKLRAEAQEVRSEKREVKGEKRERNSIGFEAEKEERERAAGLSTDREPGSLAKRLYAQHFRARYGEARTNLDGYRSHFEQIEELARQQPGPLDRVLDYVLRAFFADRSQAEYGKHSPGTLAGRGFFVHARGYAEHYEAERRVQLEREHSQRLLAKLEADTARWQLEQAERWSN